MASSAMRAQEESSASGRSSANAGTEVPSPMIASRLQAAAFEARLSAERLKTLSSVRRSVMEAFRGALSAAAIGLPTTKTSTQLSVNSLQ